MAHREVAGAARHQPPKRRLRSGFAGVEEDDGERRFQGLQTGWQAPVRHQGVAGEVARAQEGMDEWGKVEGIAGELELEDGGPRPARPGCGSSTTCGGWRSG